MFHVSRLASAASQTWPANPGGLQLASVDAADPRASSSSSSSSFSSSAASQAFPQRRRRPAAASEEGLVGAAGVSSGAALIGNRTPSPPSVVAAPTDMDEAERLGHQLFHRLSISTATPASLLGASASGGNSSSHSGPPAAPHPYQPQHHLYQYQPQSQQPQAQQPQAQQPQAQHHLLHSNHAAAHHAHYAHVHHAQQQQQQQQQQHRRQLSQHSSGDGWGLNLNGGVYGPPQPQHHHQLLHPLQQQQQVSNFAPRRSLTSSEGSAAPRSTSPHQHLHPHHSQHHQLQLRQPSGAAPPSPVHSANSSSSSSPSYSESTPERVASSHHHPSLDGLLSSGTGAALGLPSKDEIDDDFASADEIVVTHSGRSDGVVPGMSLELQGANYPLYLQQQRQLHHQQQHQPQLQVAAPPLQPQPQHAHVRHHQGLYYSSTSAAPAAPAALNSAYPGAPLYGPFRSSPQPQQASHSSFQPAASLSQHSSRFPQGACGVPQATHGFPNLAPGAQPQSHNSKEVQQPHQHQHHSHRHDRQVPQASHMVGAAGAFPTASARGGDALAYIRSSEDDFRLPTSTSHGGSRAVRNPSSSPIGHSRNGLRNGVGPGLLQAGGNLGAAVSDGHTSPGQGSGNNSAIGRGIPPAAATATLTPVAGGPEASTSGEADPDSPDSPDHSLSASASWSDLSALAPASSSSATSGAMRQVFLENGSSAHGSPVSIARRLSTGRLSTGSGSALGSHRRSPCASPSAGGRAMFPPQALQPPLCAHHHSPLPNPFSPHSQHSYQHQPLRIPAALSQSVDLSNPAVRVNSRHPHQPHHSPSSQWRMPASPPGAGSGAALLATGNPAFSPEPPAKNPGTPPPQLSAHAPLQATPVSFAKLSRDSSRVGSQGHGSGGRLSGFNSAVNSLSQSKDSAFMRSYEFLHE